jgi:hypothetical protein
MTELKEWQISEQSESGLGEQLDTASGLRHEIDFVARGCNTLVLAELKNKPGRPPGENDVIVFFAKILDYLAHNPKLLLSEVLPVFISAGGFEEPTLAACLGLGIHPVAPGLRPLPILTDNLNRAHTDVRRRFVFQDDEVAGQWDDVCAGSLSACSACTAVTPPVSAKKTASKANRADGTLGPQPQIMRELVPCIRTTLKTSSSNSAQRG